MRLLGAPEGVELDGAVGLNEGRGVVVSYERHITAVYFAVKIFGDLWNDERSACGSVVADSACVVAVVMARNDVCDVLPVHVSAHPVDDDAGPVRWRVGD